MGWAVGEGKDGRDIGYGVPALCDHPCCNARINRGLSFVCGMINSPGEDRGCGLHFCLDHLRHSQRFGQLCPRRWPKKLEPFERKPDLHEWTSHKMTDETWQEWRNTHLAEVEDYHRRIGGEEMPHVEST